MEKSLKLQATWNTGMSRTIGVFGLLYKISGIKCLIRSKKEGAAQARTLAVGFVSPGNCHVMIKCIDTVQRGRKKKIIHGKHSQIAILKIDLQSNQSRDKKLKTKWETKYEKKNM